MKLINAILLIAITHGSPYQAEPVQTDSVIVAMEEVRRKRRKERRSLVKARKRRKVFSQRYLEVSNAQ